jgi:hypothetical protein
LLRLNGLGGSIEVELLGNSILGPLLKNNVVGTYGFHNSLHWKSGSQVECLSNSEVEVFVLLLGRLSIVISVINSPSLSWCSVLSMNLDVVSFGISSTLNIKDFVVPDVSEVCSVVFEYLPPVGVGAPDLDIG